MSSSDKLCRKKNKAWQMDRKRWGLLLKGQSQKASQEIDL